ncbi:MAG: hypothetical protein HFE75_11415 [Firmicutes bacterium]|jgi:hypothetical protein|nr:hypothetical protein [Bacillota bacterium]
MANIHNLEFTKSSISGDVGKSGSLDCDILSQSENGNYFFASGSYCSSVNAEDIDSIFLFSKDSMVYRKKSDNFCVDAGHVLNDGTVYFYTEDTDFISLYPDGKQNFKKHIGVYYDAYDIGDNCAFFFGGDDDGNTVLFIYIYSSRKSIKRIIPDIEQEDDEGNDTSLYAVDTFFRKLENGFIILYSDQKTCLMFDSEGNPTVPTQSDIDDSALLLNKKLAAEKQEKLKKQAEREAYLKKRALEEEQRHAKLKHLEEQHAQQQAEKEERAQAKAAAKLERRQAKERMAAEKAERKKLATQEKRQKAEAKMRAEQKKLENLKAENVRNTEEMKEEWQKVKSTYKEQAEKNKTVKWFQIFKIVFGIILMLMLLLLTFVYPICIIGVIIGIAMAVSGIKNIKQINRKKKE